MHAPRLHSCCTSSRARKPHVKGVRAFHMRLVRRTGMVLTAAAADLIVLLSTLSRGTSATEAHTSHFHASIALWLSALAGRRFTTAYHDINKLAKFFLPRAPFPIFSSLCSSSTLILKPLGSAIKKIPSALFSRDRTLAYRCQNGDSDRAKS